MYKHIIVKNNLGVATITLNRPERMNSFIVEMHQELQQALDTIADDKNNIVYMNHSLARMFQNAQANIRKDLPNFDTNKLVGGNMDQFHKNPAHQQNLLRNLTGTYDTEIKVGGSTFSLVANAVFNDQGQRLGTAVEWTDRTAELAVEDEVSEIVSAVAMGDLSQRIDMQGKEGFFKVVGEGINNLTDICERYRSRFGCYGAR